MLKKMVTSLPNSLKEELKNNLKSKEKADNNLILDAVNAVRLNVVGRKIKRGFLEITGPGLTLTNNEIKGIIKIIHKMKVFIK